MSKKYLNYEGKKFCTEPYRTVCIGPTGGVTACCALSKYNFGLVTEETQNSLDKIYDSKEWKRFFKNNSIGNFDNKCIDACGRPGITVYNLSWKIAEREGWKHKNKKPVSADIAFSNLCNLSCTMCDSTFSSEWIKIAKKEKGECKDKPWNFSEKQVVEIAEYIKDATRIVIKGGEPMFNPRLPLFVKELAKHNTNRDFTLITNLSVVQDETLKEFNKFSLNGVKPHLQTSLESCDEDYYKLIRGGNTTTFDKFVKNLNYVKENYNNIHIRVHYLINAWSIHRLREDLEILHSLGVQKVGMDTIIGPAEQSFITQNDKVRRKAYRDIKYVTIKYPNFIENPNEMLNQFLDVKDLNKNKAKNIKLAQEYYDRRLLQGTTFKKSFNELFGEYINNHV